MTSPVETPDAIVLVHRSAPDLRAGSSKRPLFVCAEMFLDLRDIESRRWQAWSLRAGLAHAGLRVAALSDYLLAEDIDWIETHSARTAHQWYMGGEGDKTMYRGVSLGRCVEYLVKARAVRLFKLLRCVQRLLERYPDVPLYSDFDDDSTEHRVICEAHAATLRYGTSEAHELVRSPSWRLPQPLTTTIIAKGRQWGLRFVGLLAQVVQLVRRSDAPVVVVRLTPQTLKMLGAWRRSQSRPRVRFALWMDHLVRPREVVALVLAGSLVVRPAPAAAVLALPGGDSVRKRPQGRRLESVLDGLFAEVAREAFPMARSVIDHAYETFDQTHPVLLVAQNDCLLVNRAWTLAALRAGMSSLVVQHGHLDYTEDENHLTATHSAFWSDVVARQFQSAGLRPEQTIVTGSPTADGDGELQQQRGLQTSAGLRVPSGRPRVVIATTGNPGVQAYIDESWVCDYIAGVLDALSPCLDSLSITLRLHPGEDGRLYKRYLGARLPSNATMSDRGQLATVLSQADLLISPPSTAVLEARTLGLPVILLRVPSATNRQTTLERADGVVTADSYSDLPAIVRAVLARREQSGTGAAPLSEFLGPLDGRSSMRLLGAVVDLARLPRGTARTASEQRGLGSDVRD